MKPEIKLCTDEQLAAVCEMLADLNEFFCDNTDCLKDRSCKLIVDKRCLLFQLNMLLSGGANGVAKALKSKRAVYWLHKIREVLNEVQSKV